MGLFSNLMRAVTLKKQGTVFGSETSIKCDARKSLSKQICPERGRVRSVPSNCSVLPLRREGFCGTITTVTATTVIHSLSISLSTVYPFQGGGNSTKPRCKRPKEKEPAPSGPGTRRWRNISLFATLPLVVVLTVLVLGTHKEHEHPEFVPYEYMYRRTKPYWFKDGNRTAFHNSRQNALPPVGYEDEIDEEGIGQEAETEKDRQQRLSDFEKLLSNWQENGGSSNTQVKAEAVTAEEHETAAETMEKNAALEEMHPEEAEKPEEVTKLYSHKLPIFDKEE